MSAETTAAVERAAEALKAASGVTYPWAFDVTPRMLAAALSDPADPDSLARTLWLLDRKALGLCPVSPAMFDQSPSRKHWRAVADGLRAHLLGATS